MRSTHKRHTIFKYRGQEKRDRRSSVKFSSERRLFRVGRSTIESREETTRLDLFGQRHVFVPDTFRSTYRTQDVTSVVRYTRTYETACRMLAARKRIQLDWTVCRANQPTRGLPNVCVCVCSNTKEKDTFLARGARTIRSFQSPPRNRTDDKRKDYFSTSSELILFVHRPSPFLPRTTVIFSFDRCLSSLSVS